MKTELEKMVEKNLRIINDSGDEELVLQAIRHNKQLAESVPPKVVYDCLDDDEQNPGNVTKKKGLEDRSE